MTVAMVAVAVARFLQLHRQSLPQRIDMFRIQPLELCQAMRQPRSGLCAIFEHRNQTMCEARQRGWTCLNLSPDDGLLSAISIFSESACCNFSISLYSWKAKPGFLSPAKLRCYRVAEPYLVSLCFTDMATEERNHMRAYCFNTWAPVTHSKRESKACV